MLACFCRPTGSDVGSVYGYPTLLPSDNHSRSIRMQPHAFFSRHWLATPFPRGYRATTSSRMGEPKGCFSSQSPCFCFAPFSGPLSLPQEREPVLGQSSCRELRDEAPSEKYKTDLRDGLLTQYTAGTVPSAAPTERVRAPLCLFIPYLFIWFLGAVRQTLACCVCCGPNLTSYWNVNTTKNDTFDLPFS